MAFYDKWIPKEVKKPFKAIGKLSKKFLPKELRPWLPMASAFMPYTGIMGAMGGAGGFGKMYLTNLLAQQMADPDAEFDELNQLSALLSGTQGGLMGTETAGNLRDMTTRGQWGRGRPDVITGGPKSLTQHLANRSFWDKTKDLGLEGLASASDYLQGGAETLGTLGSGGELNVADMTKEKALPDMKGLFSVAGAKEALKAAAVPATKGMGDVAQAFSRPAIREYEAADLEEQRQMDETTTANDQKAADLTMRYYREAGHDEETIQVALETNGLSDFYEPPVTAAQGGIIGLRNGGMLNLGGNEMDYRGGGFVPIGKKERADDVPARLSKNEFVMTADAVKAAGGGSVNKGAQRMYNVMNQLEARA